MLNRRVSLAALRSHVAMREALVAPFSTYQMRMRPDLQLTLRANPSPPPPTSRAAVESEREHHERAC